ncbi:MAG: hypothetical protein ACYTET_03180 [Planctomycetota bacterium]|jgi:hypothetical protein
MKSPTPEKPKTRATTRTTKLSAPKPTKTTTRTTAASSGTTKPSSAPRNETELSWQQDGSVRQAFNASRIVLEDLGLAHDLSNMQNVSTRDPKTGRMIRRTVPANRQAQSDGLSAVLKGKSTAGIDFDLNILFVSPQTSQITIKAISSNQPKEILKEHSEFLKQQITETIERKPTESQDKADSTPYPKTMTFNRTANQVSKAIYDWANRERFERDSQGQDRFYKFIHCQCGSGIGLNFTIRLIDTNKARLEIEALNYEGKDEFKTILQGLQEVLEELKTGQTNQQVAYTEIMTLNKTVPLVQDAIILWAKNKGFQVSSKYSGGDQFYRYCSFDTASGIDFNFKMRLTESNQTTLEMNIRNHEDKEDFPMILKSLQDMLAELNQDKPVPENAASQDID